MVVSTKSLNWDSRAEFLDFLAQSAESWEFVITAGRCMAKDDEKVNGFGCLDGIDKPGFLDKICSFDDLGDVGVKSEIEEDTKGHDIETMLGSKVAVLAANVFVLAGLLVDDLDVTGHVSLAVDFGEVCKCLIGDIGHVQFMVSDAKQVIVEAGEDIVGDDAIGRGRVT